MKKVLVALITLVVMISLLFGVSGCAKPAPAPSPAPAPAPAPTPAPAPAPAPVPAPAPAKPAEIKPLAELPAAIKAKLPSIISIGSHAVGSAGMVSNTAMGEAAGKVLGITVKATPYGTDVARYKALEAGEAIAISVSGGIHMDYAAGIVDFKGWVPKKTRLVWYHYPSTASIGAAPDIKTWKDLKGKRWAYPTYSPGHAKICTAYFVMNGVNPDDLVRVPAPSFVRSVEMVGEGAADCVLFSATTPKIIELVAAGKMRPLPLPPPEDKEAWERHWEWAPAYSPSFVDYGACKGNPMWVSQGNYSLVALDTTSSDITYALSYGFHKGYPGFKDVQANVTDTATLENTLKLLWWKNIPMAFHPGTVKYFKDIGAWTPEHEAYQEMALVTERRMHEIRKAWAEEKPAK